MRSRNIERFSTENIRFVMLSFYIYNCVCVCVCHMNELAGDFLFVIYRGKGENVNRGRDSNQVVLRGRKAKQTPNET